MTYRDLPVVWSSALFTRSGYAEEARNVALALDSAGVDIRLNPRQWIPWQRRLADGVADRLEGMVVLEAPERFVHVMHFLPDTYWQHPRAVRHIGRTMWETDSLPPGWREHCHRMDELWVASHFNVETFAEAGVAREKLHVIPECLQVELFDASLPPLEMEAFSGFVFLSIFGWSRRKGWDILVRAYLEEFGPDEDVTLALHVTRYAAPMGDPVAELTSFITEELGVDPRRGPRIVLLEFEPGAARMPQLYLAADAFVLPSHGEGWGRPYMEAMAMGLPTIGTGWSGNMEFMNDENSYLVDCELVDVSEAAWREWPRFRGQKWAEPSLPHLRSLMRRVIDQPEEARARGAVARRQILERYTPERVAGAIIERLQAGSPVTGTASSTSGTQPAASAATSRSRPRSAPRIGCCVVARDHSATLPSCLESVRGLADDLVVVDLGSTDRSGEIAASYGARLFLAGRENLTAARNLALRESQGDWILVLDGDESLDQEAPEEIRRRLVETEEPVGYQLRRLSPTGREGPDPFLPQLAMRLFPHLPDIRYAGDFRPRLSSVGRLSPVPCSAIIHHEGYRPGGGELADRRQDLSLLAELVRKHPEDAFYACELGLSLSLLGRRIEAREQLLRAAELAEAEAARGPALDHIVNAHLLLAILFLEDEDDGQAAKVARSALQLAPGFAEAHLAFAAAVERLGLLVIAQRAYERASSVEGPGGGHGLAGMGRLALRGGRLDEAHDILRRAVSARRAPAIAWRDLAEVERLRGRIKDARRVLREGIARHPNGEELQRTLAQLAEQSG